MPFRFTLEPVLRVAKIREDQEVAQLQSIHTAIAGVRCQLEQLAEDERCARREFRDATSGGGTSGAWLHAFNQTLESSRQGKRWLQEQLIPLKQRLLAQQRICAAARQKTETLSRLRDTQVAEYEREVQKREQVAVDDLFLNRYR